MATGTIHADSNNIVTETNIPSSYLTGVTSGTMNVIKCGRLCIGRIGAALEASTTASGWTTLGTFPNGFQPSNRVTFLLADDTVGVLGSSVECRVDHESNSLQVYSPTQGHKYWGSFTYFCK